MGADRRVARGAERAHELALGGDARGRGRGRRSGASDRRPRRPGGPRAPARPGRRRARARRARRRPRPRARAGPARPARARSRRPPRRRACAGACRRCRAARTTSRSSRSARGSARRGAGCSCPTRAPAASAPSDGAPQIASRGSSRAGIADQLQPGRQLGGHVLGRVHGEVDLARRAAPARARTPSATCRRGASRRGRRAVVIVTSLGLGAAAARATQPACASASALPRVPIRISARCAARADLAPGSSRRTAVGQRLVLVDGRARTARGPAPSARARGRRAAPSSAAVGSCSRRLTIARAIASTRSRSRSEADSHLPVVLAQHLLGDLGGVRAQRGQRRAAPRASPARWRSCWISSSTIPSARRASAWRTLRLRATTACRSSMSYSDDAGDLGARGVDVARARRGRSAAADAHHAATSPRRAPRPRAAGAARRWRRPRCRPPAAPWAARRSSTLSPP